MKQIPTETYTLTEIGGVGEMIYRAVRFPEYVSEFDHARKVDVIVPLFTVLHNPTVGTDYSITGQDILAGLCNLYKRINAPDYSEHTTELVCQWCRDNIHPYGIDELCDEMETRGLTDVDFLEDLKRYATFDVDDFVEDVCKLGRAFEYYDALTSVKYSRDVEAGRNLYYEGKHCDSLAFLEHFMQYTDDEEYLKHFDEEYDDLLFNLLEMFPDFKLRLKQDRKTHKAELAADINTVFDIAWYAFARMVADVAPPADVDPDYEFSQGSILTCMACGNYFVRHSSRQRYCNNPDCQAARNNRKARAYYKRKKADETV